MKTSVQMQLAKLPEMSTGELAQRYTELFGEPTRTRHKAYLVRKIAWRMQALAEGDLSERAKRRAEELAHDADIRLTPPRSTGEQSEASARLYVSGASDPRLPAPGGAIVRKYKGRAVRVLVTEDGFEYEGERYRSLTAVAKAVSGSHCNGFRFKDDAIGAWRGIADALAAGDIALAAKILWLSLTMEWRRGINYLNGLWIQFKDFFLSTVTGAVYGAARILNDGWAAIEVGWTETIGFLSDAWSVFTNLLTKTWHTAVGFIPKAWVRLKSLFDEDINVDAEVTRINREVEQSNAGADQGMLEAVGKRDQERRARRSQIEADRTGIEQTLGEMQSTEDARRQSQFAQDLADTEGELARAREEWQAAIGKAAEERAATGMTDPTRLKKLQDSLADSGSLLGDEQRKIDTQGTFSALAARGLGADSLAERTARATEQVVANTKQLVDQAKQGKLIFTS